MTVVDQTPERPTLRRALAALLAVQVVVAAAGAALVLLPVPVYGAVPLTLLLVSVPVVVATRRVRWAERGMPYGPLFGVGLALLLLILLALLLNTVLPLVGQDRPLARTPMAIGLAAADLLILCWRTRTPLVTFTGLRRGLRLVVRARLDLGVPVGVVAVVLAVAGAVRLNNGLDGGVATAAHVAALLTLALVLLRRERGFLRDGVGLYLAGASLLLSTSLRGWTIIGHDIQHEYFAYLLTQAGDRWQMSALPDAYNACLSVNVLPTTLSNLTGVPGVMVYKVVLQLLFAIAPVIVYAIGRTFVERRLAVLGVIFFLVFPTFFNDMPYLVRQEVAFVFNALTVLALVSRGLGLWRRSALVVVLGVGVVLSHYSTTYLMLLMMIGATVGLRLTHGLERWNRRRRGLPRLRRPRSLPWEGLVAVLIVLTYVWVSPVTHSGGHAKETVRGTLIALLGKSSGPGSSDLAYAFIAQQVSPRQRFDLYLRDVVAPERPKITKPLLPRVTQQDISPQLLNPVNLPLTPVGRALTHRGVDVGVVNNLARLVSAGVIQVWLLLGVFLLLIGRGRLRRTALESRWLVAAALPGVGAVVVVPFLSVEYGVLRAFQQCLIAASPAVAVGAVATFSWLGRFGRWIALPVVSVGSLVMGTVLLGVLPLVTGGFPGALALANSGAYYDLYFMKPTEVRGMQWLDQAAAPTRPRVAVDDVASQRLSVASLGRLRIASDFYPVLLRQGQWVFVDSQGVQRSQATIFYTGNLISYRYPYSELRGVLATVYSNPDSAVMR